MFILFFSSKQAEKDREKEKAEKSTPSTSRDSSSSPPHTDGSPELPPPATPTPGSAAVKEDGKDDGKPNFSVPPTDDKNKEEAKTVSGKLDHYQAVFLD